MTQINSLIKTFKKRGSGYLFFKYRSADLIRGTEVPKSIPSYLLTYTDKYGCGVYYNRVFKVPHSNGVLFFALRGYSDEAAVIINLKSDGTFEVLEDNRLCKIA